MFPAALANVGDRIWARGALGTVFVVIPSRDETTVTIHFEEGAPVTLPALELVGVEDEA